MGGSSAVIPLELQLPYHKSIQFYSCLAPHSVYRYSMTYLNEQFRKVSTSAVNLPCLSVCISSDYIIPIFGLPESAFIAMLILYLMTLHYFYLRVRTVLQCVLLVYMDQAACPPAPAIITHPALQSTAPASAGKVLYN